MYEEGINNDSADYILDRALFKSLIYKDHIKDYFNSRVGLLSSWKYPGIFIRPEHGEYVNKMTASDPLYIVDQTAELLEPATKLWNDTYQNRVRYKIINEDRDTIFKNFPEGQIGLVVAMNFMNYKPIEIIKQYLLELFDLLRPGGSFIFTYNNCNYPLAVKNFEKALYSYTPESLILPMCKLVGYEVIESYNDIETSVSWLELKKPGKLKTQRGGQCLGKVIV
jgi:SAM-dependent methyltransferase